jgi:spore coat polysaccharide biosynthesis protein SpsF
MIGVIVQARTGSTRLPRKIYKDLGGKYTLQRVLEGCSSAQLPHKIILAMPLEDEKEFNHRHDFGKEFYHYTDERFSTYFGSADNLVERYFGAARQNGLDLIVRITADCPLIDGEVIDQMLLEYMKNGYTGFMGNNAQISPIPHPTGMDVEIFPYWMLAETYQLAKDPADLEHCTRYMYRRSTQYKIHSFLNIAPNKMVSRRYDSLALDTEDDYWFLRLLCAEYDSCGDLNKAIHNCTSERLKVRI